MFTADQVANHILSKLEAIDIEKGTNYAERYNLSWIKALIRVSLKKIGETKDRISDENRQRLQRAFGVIHRDASQVVRHKQVPNNILLIHTKNRKRDSIGISALRYDRVALFLDEFSFSSSDDETKVVLQEVKNDVTLPRMAFQQLENSYYFKTPLNVVIANHEPEFEFIRYLTKSSNATALDSWIKSTDKDFYAIKFALRKGEHTKRAAFNPDFFLKVDNHIYVIEIKGDEQLIEPSDENKVKYRAATQHFDTLNSLQDEQVYHFHFLAQADYDIFFQFLRERNYNYVSKLDAVLGENLVDDR